MHAWLGQLGSGDGWITIVQVQCAAHLIDAAIEESGRVWAPGSNHEWSGADERWMIGIAGDETVDCQAHRCGSDVVTPDNVCPFAIGHGHIEVVIVATYTQAQISCRNIEFNEGLKCTCRSPCMVACIVEQNVVPCSVC